MILNLRVSVIYLTPFLVTACAGNPDAQTAAATSSSCVREYPTGSNIPVLNCSAPQTEAERQRSLDEAKAAIRTIPRMPGKGEGG